MKRIGLTIITLLGVMLVVGLVSAQNRFGFPASKFAKYGDYLLTDYSYLRTDNPDVVKLELYYQIHHRGLTFMLERDRYTANYELLIRVEDNDGEVVKEYTRVREIVIPGDEEPRTRVDFRTSQINLELPLGKYKVFFKLKDKSTGKLNRQELKLKLKSLHQKRPQMSIPEFAQAFYTTTDSGSVFSKADMIVVPSVHRVFGGQDTGRVVFYFEIYNGTEEHEKIVVETKIRHYRKGMLYRDTLHLELGDEPLRQLREISLAEILPGEYELDISLRGRRNKLLSSRSSDFKVAWTLEGMIRHDWKATIAQLRLFSVDTDVGDMDKLKTVAERQAAFDQFWQERDPTIGTVENEVKTAFYYRVRAANERFGIMKKDGWRTDRGRAYVRYGEPDYLTDEPFALDRQPYQIWHFVTISPNRHFLFIDENDDGDYRLQYPFDGLGWSGNF